MDKNDIRIVVSAYKRPFEMPKHESYFPVFAGASKLKDTYLNTDVLDDTGDNISIWNPVYAELTNLYWAWKNLPKTKFFGFNSYRRYFYFKENIPDMNEIFKTTDIITIPYTKLYEPSLAQQYSNAHNIEDLNLMASCILSLYGYEEYNKFMAILSQPYLLTNDIFIMKYEDLDKWCSFLFTLCSKFLDRKNWKNPNDVIRYIDKNRNLYLKEGIHPNDKAWYQSQIFGFLAERVFTYYVASRFKSPSTMDIVLTETKYNKFM